MLKVNRLLSPVFLKFILAGDHMLQIQAHGQYRNLGENALQGIEIAKDNIFYGLNGAGKSTICEAIANSTLKIKNSENGEEIDRVYVFNKHWVEEKVGEFVKGGNAPGITTVVLGEESQNALKHVNKLERELEKLTKEQDSKIIEKNSAEEAQQEIIDGIFEGSRGQHKDSPALTGNAFSRRNIRNIVSDPNNRPTLLSLEDLQKHLEVTKMEEIPPLPLLPDAPTIEEIKDEVWNYLREPLPFKDELVKSITKWAEEGLNIHSAGENCQFCGNLVTEKRISDLNEAISRKLELRPPYIAKVEDNFKTLIEALREYWQSIKSMNIGENVYTKKLSSLKESLLNNITLVGSGLKELLDLLEKKSYDLDFKFDSDPIDIPISELNDSISCFEREHSQAEGTITEHKKNLANSKKALQSHFCAADGGLKWPETEKEIIASVNELKKIKSQIELKNDEITELKASISGINEVAKFIDTNLRNILGSDSLEVSVGEKDEGYRITRRGDSAKDMSEGEKKLIALLYFFAELQQEETKKI